MYRETAHFDRVIVPVPADFPAVAAAMMAVEVAKMVQASRIIIDQGTRKTDYDVRDVEAMIRRNCPNGGRELGFNLPEQREPRRPLWTISLPPDICPSEEGDDHG